MARFPFRDYEKAPLHCEVCGQPATTVDDLTGALVCAGCETPATEDPADAAERLMDTIAVSPDPIGQALVSILKEVETVMDGLVPPAESIKVDYHNVVSTIEVMMPTPHGTLPTDEEVRAFIELAVKRGLWWHVTGSRVIHTATEDAQS